MSDQQQRQLAVEPQRSVIVQAPAGSGKTSLLVERYLGLLAVVDEPEEILAITFTRKAAAEMRQRILTFLDPGFTSDQAHEQTALARARAVEDKVRAWGLRDNPQRMLIRTIDSFNHYLARTMPVASQLGPVPAPAENTQTLYREAARRVLDQAESHGRLANDIRRLLLWRDHRSRDIEDLLVSLLARRDQWLRALGVSGKPDRERFEAVLQQRVCEQLARTELILGQALTDAGIDNGELVELLRSAAETLIAEHRDSEIQACADITALPGSNPDDLDQWRGLGEALLTRNGGFRKSVTIATGFPPRTPQKERMCQLLEAIGHGNHLAELLHEARNLPDPRYSDAEWDTLAAMVRVLEHAAGELDVVFASAGQTDFAGLSRAALRGLGDEEAGYTDLALYLDQRIRHILVDEYQDTNWAQFELLTRLVGGWQPGEARSLFVVGDPMQSIYRFREAEVGLFMRTREHGIGNQPLESLRLSRNFRSRSEIVDWVNQRLGPIFPQTENVAAGAVSYARSEPGRGTGGEVRILARADAVAEGEAVAETIGQALAANRDQPGYKAAIIVRARGHLAEILPALKRHGIAYRAVKLDPLIGRAVVQDLLALTRAILQPLDSTAVLTLLRSPMCGLSLVELHALAGDGKSLHDPLALEQLDGEARVRAEKVFTTLTAAEQLWQRRSVREIIEGAWHQLGGPQCCQHPATDLKDAQAYFEALSMAESEDLITDWNDFAELLEGQFTEGDPPSENVRLEILTMHGAKGLEWDLVVLPGLNRGTRGQGRDMLNWLPFTPDEGDEQVLLAPLRAADQARDPALNELIRTEQKKRDAFEHQRLLYVAATRAREQLVLSACLDPGRDDIKPSAGSLLADLWPTTGHEFIQALEAAPAPEASESAQLLPDQGIQRAPASWQPSLGERLDFQPELPPREHHPEIEFNWAGIQARRSGTVIHRLLERVGRIGIENLDDSQRRRLIDRIPILLKAMGSGTDAVDQATAVIAEAFERTLDGEVGQWILSHRHRQAACELPISGLLDGQLVHAVIDRTFISDDGTRWIIDYKSGYHEGGDLAGFLAEEATRYQVQLHNYRRLFEQMGETSIRTALYLPRHGELQEV
jgi:ATP-dependent helicase/nuclease subunit A